MKYFLAILFIVSGLSTNAVAKLGPIDLKELIEGSDLIVVGTLTEFSEYTENHTEYSEGVITIRQLIAGSARTLGGRRVWPGDALIVKWQADIACLIGLHRSDQNLEGVWLLTIENETARANRPGSFIRFERLPEIIELLNTGTHIEDTEKQTRVLSERSEFEDKMAAISAANCELRKPRGDTYSSNSALLVFIASVMLYMVLYRNRFK